jgi:hypothetical protein
MPGAYADHEMPTMVPTVTIEDQLGKQDHRPDCVPRTGPEMVTVGTIVDETVAK